MGKGTTPKASNAGSAAASRVSHSSMKISHTNIKSKAQTPTSSMTKSTNSAGQRLKGMVKSLFGAKPLVQEDIEPSGSSSEMIPPLTKPIPGKSQGSQTSSTPKRSERLSAGKLSANEVPPTPIATNNSALQQQEALFPAAVTTLATMASAALAQALSNNHTSTALTSSLASSQGLSARDLALTTSNLQQLSVEHPASFGANYNSLNKSVAQHPLSINQSSVRPPAAPAEQEYVILPASIINMYMAMKNKGTSILQSPAKQVRPALSDSVPLRQSTEPAIKRAVHFEAPSNNASSIPHSTGSIIRGDALEFSTGFAENGKELVSKKVVMREEPKPVEPTKQIFGTSETNSESKEETPVQAKNEPPKAKGAFLFGETGFASSSSASQPKDNQNTVDSTAASDTQDKASAYSFKFGNASEGTGGDPSSNTKGFSFSVKKEEPTTGNSTLKSSQSDTASESTSRPKGFIFGAPAAVAAITEAPKPVTSLVPSKPTAEQPPEQKKEQPTFSFGSMSATNTKGFGFTPSAEEPRATSTMNTTGFSFTAPSSSAKQTGGFSFQVSTPPVQFGAAPQGSNASSTQGIVSGSGGTQPSQFIFGGFNSGATGSSGQSVFGVGVSPFAAKPLSTGEVQGSQAGSGQFSFTFSNPTVKPQLS